MKEGIFWRSKLKNDIITVTLEISSGGGDTAMAVEEISTYNEKKDIREPIRRPRIFKTSRTSRTL